MLAHSLLNRLYVWVGVCPDIFASVHLMPATQYPINSKSGSAPSHKIRCNPIISVQAYAHFPAWQTETEDYQLRVFMQNSNVMRLYSHSPFTGLSQLLTVSAVVFVSQHDSISQAQCQDDMTIWPLIKEQVPLQLYTSRAAQTSFQYAIYLPLLLARCWAQTEMFIPVLCSVVHQCD